MQAAILFPGQGCQFVGMGKPFYDQFSYIRDIYEEISEITKINFPKICFEGPIYELNRTRYAQPAIFIHGLSIFSVIMRETSIEPVVCCGHSMGEITALTAAGAIKTIDALHLINARAKLMDDCAIEKPGSMTAVITNNISSLQELCIQIEKEYGMVLEISNYNSVEQSVVSGNTAAVAFLEAALRKLNIRAIRLKTSGAFHCRLMRDASDKFREILKSFVFYPTTMPVISSVTGELYDNHFKIPDLLSTQIVLPVHWIKCIEFISQYANLSVDTSPNGILQKLIKKEGITCINLNTVDQLAKYSL